MTESYNSSIPYIDPASEIFFSEDNRIVIRKDFEITTINGIDRLDFEALLKEIDGKRTVGEIIAALEARYLTGDIYRFFKRIEKSLLRFEPYPAIGSPSKSPTKHAVAIIGNSSHALRLTERFRVSGNDTVFYHLETLTNGDSVNCNEIVMNHHVVICLLENTPYSVMLDFNKACMRVGTPCLFITVMNSKIVIGPLVIPHQTVCLECSLIALYGNNKLDSASFALKTIQQFKSSQLGSDFLTEEAFSKVINRVYNDIEALLSRLASRNLNYIDNVEVLEIGNNPSIHRNAIQKSALCSECSCVREESADDAVQGETGYSKLVVALNQNQAYSHRPLLFNRESNMGRSHVYHKIGILGGGTAGYLTALAIKKRFPGIEVSLIESSKIPIIGVGEATTPLMKDYLFKYLEFDPLDFYARVQPTWKLGIKFFWGMPGDYFFNYPFGQTDIWSAYLLNNDINYSSLSSLLMASNSSFVLEDDSKYFSLSKDLVYAYHIDNNRFVRYLKEKALSAGVVFFDEIIKHVSLKENGDVGHLLTEDGRMLSFDLYVDCSGFKSVLLAGAAGSGFREFSKSLYTDTAVVANVPNDGLVKPYTLAETMNCGWNWNISMRDEDHRGYVFSSSFCSVDQAVSEMRSKNPRMGDYRVVKFRSGRHEHFWKGNVVGIGNSYGFVEPLESTGLHMILYEVQTLVNNLTSNSPVLKDRINREMNTQWDYLRWFLSIHYRFNRKLNTDFWRECREHVDISGVEELIHFYKENGLLSYQSMSTKELLQKSVSDDLFGLSGIDNILLGQGIVPDKISQLSDRQRNAWLTNVARWTAIIKCSLPLKRDLDILLQHPHLI